MAVRPDDADALPGRTVEPAVDGRLENAGSSAPAGTIIGIILGMLG